MPLIEDWRIPSRHAFVLTEGRKLVKIPDEVRECVCFLLYDSRKHQREVIAGTAFIASEPIPDTHSSFRWVVTAAHVLNGVLADSADGIVRLRLNSRSGGFVTIASDASSWDQHPTYDVAATVGIATDEVDADARYFPLDDRNIASDAM